MYVVFVHSEKQSAIEFRICVSVCVRVDFAIERIKKDVHFHIEHGPLNVNIFWPLMPLLSFSLHI